MLFFISFPLTGYISWLAENQPDLMTDALENAPTYCAELIEHMSISHAKVTLTVAESAELLLGKASLSRRAYKGLKKALKRKNVHLASCKETLTYISSLQTGQVSSGQCGLPGSCMCATTDFTETMKLVLACKKLVDAMTFPDVEQNRRLLKLLYDKHPALYGNAFHQRCENRTLLIRETGDNFRTAGKKKTEQDSFNILNLRKLVSSPFGQFINGIWHGPETRQLLKAHLTATYQELDECVRHGLTATLPDGTRETFNVVVFYVADLGHKTEVLGRVATTAKYGCPHCCKPSDDWSKLGSAGKILTTQDLVAFGKKAHCELGDEPEKGTARYTRTHQANFGQTSIPLFSSFAAECNVACSLHTILAIHRQMWKVVDHVISVRDQCSLLADALRAAGCDYMAYQVKSFYESKKKYYDGSETMKVTGEDCRLLEENIDKFVQVS